METARRARRQRRQERRSLKPGTLGWLVLSLIVVTGCGTAAPQAGHAAPQAGHAAPQAGHAAQQAGYTAASARGTVQLVRATGQQPGPVIGPISATFISASTGWLLAVAPCRTLYCTSLRMRKTTDGGRHWFAVRPPPVRMSNWPPGLDGKPWGPSGSVDSVVFATASDGWAYGPGLWATTDGGASWHWVRTHGMSVISLATARHRAVAVFSRYRHHQLMFQVRRALAGSDSWRPVAGASGRGLGTVAASGRTGYLSVVPIGRHGFVVPDRPVLLLAGPVSGAGRWQRRPMPCHRGRIDIGDFGAPIAAARDSDLLLACAGEPYLGLQSKRAFESTDGGRRWRRLANPYYGGYLGNVSLTAAGTIFWSGQRSSLWVSRDHGRSWHRSASLSNGDGMVAEMTTSTQGFAFADGLSPAGQIWLTRNDGRTWTMTVIR
jgi:photosystem II stability/assembly factor-like uncharacterized protein